MLVKYSLISSAAWRNRPSERGITLDLCTIVTFLRPVRLASSKARRATRSEAPRVMTFCATPVCPPSSVVSLPT